MRTSLTNGQRTFIGYADSCLTNQFDVSDAVSESLVQNEQGGAVAYVGNTRFSWIGVGDDFQRNFFKGLPAPRALGILNDRRLAMLGIGTGFWPVYTNWSIFSLNLIGDPEMRIWTRVPWRLCLEVPATIRIDRLLRVQVLHGETPVAGAIVTIEQPGLHLQRTTDRDGVADFELKGASSGELRIIAFHPEASLMTTTIQVIGASWHEMEVNAVHIRADSATAVLRDAQGERTAIAPEGNGHVLATLNQAAGTGRTIRVLLGDDATIEAVELGNGKAPEE